MSQAYPVQSLGKVSRGMVNAMTAGEDMVQIANRIPRSTHKALKLYCQENDVLMGVAIERAIYLLLNDKGGK